MQTCEVQHGGGPSIGESADTGIGLTFIPDPNREWALPERD
ncbi:MAG: hypothetical protein QGH20_05235 [Candidatus Latescibacteria bacterium]|nr:hypothetical protein [Candidatus Latescibacterota bacterium]